MSVSFEEKSIWIQLVAQLLVMGGYLVTAGRMLANGVRELPAFAPVFIISVVLLVIVLIAGHILAALTGKAEDADERDRLIGWRAEARSGWVLGVGVLAAISAMVLSVDSTYVAHGLFLSLFVSQLLAYVLQLLDYRRGF